MSSSRSIWSTIHQEVRKAQETQIDILAATWKGLQVQYVSPRNPRYLYMLAVHNVWCVLSLVQICAGILREMHVCVLVRVRARIVPREVRACLSKCVRGMVCPYVSNGVRVTEPCFRASGHSKSGGKFYRRLAHGPSVVNRQKLAFLFM